MDTIIHPQLDLLLAQLCSIIFSPVGAGLILVIALLFFIVYLPQLGSKK